MIILKTPKQIEGIRKSCRLAAQALKFIEPYVKSGVSTIELNDKIEAFIRYNKATPAPLGYKGFPAATCISINEVICHGIPSDRTLKDGDIVNIDVTTILNGYYGDTSTMFKVGNISDEAQKLLDVTKKCLEIGIAQVRPGNYTGNIGYEINEYAVKNGFSTVYTFCGHGCGTEFHDDLQIPHIAPKNSGIKMRRGMTFTVEPMINQGLPECLINEADGWTATTIDGKLSAQYEHHLVVTQNGCEVMTDIG